MEKVTIQARSVSSARGMLRALSAFHAELVEADDGGAQVTVELSGGDREIVAFLNALERYINERDAQPARIELNGHSYVMHPTEDPTRQHVGDEPLRDATEV